MFKNLQLKLSALVVILFLGWCGWKSVEIDRNFDLLDHCAAQMAKPNITQAVCVNDETEVGIVECKRLTVGIRCTMDGLDYDFD